MIEPTPQEVIASLQSVIRQLGAELETVKMERDQLKSWQERVDAEIGQEPEFPDFSTIDSKEYFKRLNEHHMKRAEHLAARNAGLVKALKAIEQFGHGAGHGRGFTCADMAAAAQQEQQT